MDTTAFHEACIGAHDTLKRLKVDPSRDDLGKSLRLSVLARRDTLAYLLPSVPARTTTLMRFAGATPVSVTRMGRCGPSPQPPWSRLPDARLPVYEREAFVCSSSTGSLKPTQLRERCPPNPYTIEAQVTKWNSWPAHQPYARRPPARFPSSARMQQHCLVRASGSAYRIDPDGRRKAACRIAKPSLYVLASYDREKLYNDVWSEPTQKVAARYGISDVALAKACRQLQIPKPPRGYWAKKAAGRTVSRRKLSPLKM